MSASRFSNKGRAWESEVEAQHRQYEADDRAVCIRNEPTRGGDRADDEMARGKPDWTVAVRGRTFGLEVKDTTAKAWRYRDLSEWQAKRMDRLTQHGWDCYLLVRTRAAVYLVAWPGIAEAWWRNHLDGGTRTVDLATVGIATGVDYLDAMIG